MNVKLRAVEPEDVDFMLECESDSEASKWSDYRAPLSRSQLLTYALTYDADPFSAGQIRLIAIYDGNKIGIADLYDISEKDSKAFVGITIHPQFRGKGLGVKALKALLEMAGSQLGVSNIVAKISVENVPAAGLFRKAGFTEIAILPRWHKIGNDFHDFRLFQLRL